MDVNDDALMRPGRGAAAVNVDDVGQGAGGGPGGNDVVVVGPGVVGDVDFDIRMPLHEAFVVFSLARAEGRFPVPAEGQLDLVLGGGDAAQGTQPRKRGARAGGRCQLKEIAA